jgi:hypothetical protein
LIFYDASETEQHFLGCMHVAVVARRSQLDTFMSWRWLPADVVPRVLAPAAGEREERYASRLQGG